MSCIFLNKRQGQAKGWWHSCYPVHIMPWVWPPIIKQKKKKNQRWAKDLLLVTSLFKIIKSFSLYLEGNLVPLQCSPRWYHRLLSLWSHFLLLFLPCSCSVLLFLEHSRHTSPDHRFFWLRDVPADRFPHPVSRRLCLNMTHVNLNSY